LPLGTLRASRLYSTESGRTSLCDSDDILGGGVTSVLLFWSYTNTNCHCTQQQPGAFSCFFTLQTKLPLNIWISVQYWLHSGFKIKGDRQLKCSKSRGDNGISCTLWMALCTAAAPQPGTTGQLNHASTSPITQIALKLQL
jgi:hypothetical protein